jgi:glycosyltransferase involved in cell wall biosynthesis
MECPGNGLFRIHATTPFDSVVYVSSEDKRIFSERYPEMQDKIKVLKIGLDLSRYVTERAIFESSPRSVIFTGNMRYRPNRDAVMWFYKNVFVKLKEECTGIVWHVVGRDASKYIRIDDPQVIIHRSVPSVIPYVQAATLVISPLRSGTGLKNKILEAMVCRKVVVGSPLSFDGIPICNNVHAAIASSPDEYIAQVIKYLDDSAQRKHVGDNAFELIRDNFDLAYTVEGWKQVIQGGVPVVN